MSVVLLVRHGQASWGAVDYDQLSELGVAQAGVVGRALAARGTTPDVVLTAGLRRHLQTTEAMVAGAGWHDVALEVEEGWNEFDHLSRHSGQGSVMFEGETYEERVRHFEDSIGRWFAGEHDPEYVESFPAFRARVDDALRRTLGRLSSSQVAVVVTSGGPVSWVTASLLDGGVPTWARLSQVVVNCSVTKLVDGRSGPTLLTFNDHSHLEVEAGHLTYR